MALNYGGIVWTTKGEVAINALHCNKDGLMVAWICQKVEAILRSGTTRTLGAGFGDLNIMLTDDETFRCYIPIANKTSSHLYYMDPANEGVTSNETRIPGYDLNDPLRFKKYSSVEHRHFAKTVFLLPYAYRTDDTLASVYENVFDRSMSQ